MVDEWVILAYFPSIKFSHPPATFHVLVDAAFNGFSGGQETERQIRCPTNHTFPCFLWNVDDTTGGVGDRLSCSFVCRLSVLIFSSWITHEQGSASLPWEKTRVSLIKPYFWMEVCSPLLVCLQTDLDLGLDGSVFRVKFNVHFSYCSFPTVLNLIFLLRYI